MKHLLCISLIVLLSGCYTSKNNNPEVMADLASQLKDIASAVDGTLKFSETPYSSTDELLKAAVNNDLSKLTPFNEYTFIVDVQDDNAVLLLCDADTALIEDAGCTAQSDIQHWKSGALQQCKITINAQQLCN
ncbi:hypothetical protein [Pseudoalteromonas distincta]|uniref:hypothetical protein n=1 Tax=Pseudoalteromonas distincta TaxID=77608 RepID=UPI0039EC7EF2